METKGLIPVKILVYLLDWILENRGIGVLLQILLNNFFSLPLTFISCYLPLGGIICKSAYFFLCLNCPIWYPLAIIS